jgi:hypothetical protein
MHGYSRLGYTTTDDMSIKDTLRLKQLPEMKKCFKKAGIAKPGKKAKTVSKVLRENIWNRKRGFLQTVMLMKKKKEEEEERQRENEDEEEPEQAEFQQNVWEKTGAIMGKEKLNIPQSKVQPKEIDKAVESNKFTIASGKKKSKRESLQVIAGGAEKPIRDHAPSKVVKREMVHWLAVCERMYEGDSVGCGICGKATGKKGKKVPGHGTGEVKLCCECAARLPNIGESRIMEGLLLVMWLGMEWIGEEKAKRTMGSPKGWKRAAEWMRKAEWKGTIDQDWKMAVEKCTGVTEAEGYKWDSAEESPQKERKWEIDENDNIYMMLKRFGEEKGKMIEGCYGPKPEELKQLRRIQARWACSGTAELVRYALKFSAVATKRTVPEEVVEVDQAHGQGNVARTDGNLHAPGIEPRRASEEEVQATRTVNDSEAEKTNSTERGEGKVHAERDTQMPRAHSGVSDEGQCESVPRGRKRGREKRADVRNQDSTVRTRERLQTSGAGSNKRCGQRRDTRQPTGVPQTVVRESRVHTRRSMLIAESAGAGNERMTRSKVRKKDGDGAVT